jgi:putative membrane protein
LSKSTFSAAVLIFGMCALLAFVFAAGSGMAQNSNSNSKMSADQKFALEAAMGGMLEVELGRVAVEKGASDEVRQFGRRMVDDHSKANEELMRVANGKGMSLPNAIDPKHRSEMQKLSALSGEKFDKEYVKLMLKDHKQAVAAFEKEANGGMDADLKALAASTLPTLRAHLQMIQRISDKMVLRKSGHLKTMSKQ